MELERPTARAGVVARDIWGETVLVPTRVGVAEFRNVFLLNKVGTFLWQQLDGTRDRAALCELVRERFAVPAEHDVGVDVDRFLGELQARNLLVAGAAAPGAK